MRHTPSGFTLLEVLVALVIVGVSLGASLRAIGSLAQSSDEMRASMMANWSAENQMVKIRLSRAWPDIGTRSTACPQGDLQLICISSVFVTPNPHFRRVEVSVFDAGAPQRRLSLLDQRVADAR